jgi:hypothetical protein
MFHQSSHGKTLFLGHENETNIAAKAVNGPLQQRTTVLDSDLREAATFPSDYETDLESDWSKFGKIIFSFPILFNDLHLRFRFDINNDRTTSKYCLSEKSVSSSDTTDG